MYIWSQDRPSPNVGLKIVSFLGTRKIQRRSSIIFVQSDCGTDIYIVTVPVVVS